VFDRFTARSVVASLLLPLDPPAMSVRALLRCGELFGIAEGTVRVALTRMVAAGELARGGGRYHLTGAMLERHDRQRAARHPALAPWTGQWIGAMIVADRRSATDRAELRRGLAHCHLAELRPGVWLRPDNLTDLPASARGLGPQVAKQCAWVRLCLATDIGASGDIDLALALWDLAGWATAARRLIAALDSTLPRLVAGDINALAPCFSIAAAAVRHIVDDPLLPPALLPQRWPGAALRRRYEEYERAYARVLESWLR